MDAMFSLEKESKTSVLEKDISQLKNKKWLVFYILLIVACVCVRLWAEDKARKVPFPNYVSTSDHAVAISWGRSIYLLDHRGEITDIKFLPDEIELTQLKLIDDEIWIADVKTKSIYKMKEKGLELVVNGNNIIHSVFKFAFNQDGDKIYITDCSNHRGHIFNRQGRYEKSFSREGKGPGELKFPNSIVLMDDGNFLIVNTNAHRLDIYAPDGSFVRPFAEVESIGKEYIPRRSDFLRSLLSDVDLEKLGKYEWPTLLARSGDKVVFLLGQNDLQKSKVVVYDSNGRFTGELDPPKPLRAAGDITAWRNTVMVTDNESREIYLFDPDTMSFSGFFSSELQMLAGKEKQKEKYYKNISLAALAILFLIFIPIAILLWKQRTGEMKEMDSINVSSLVGADSFWTTEPDRKKMIAGVCLLVGFTVITVVGILFYKKNLPLLLSVLILNSIFITFSQKYLLKSGYLSIAKRSVIEKMIKQILSRLRRDFKADETIVGCTTLQSSRSPGRYTLVILTNQRLVLADFVGSAVRFTPISLSYYEYGNIRSVKVEKSSGRAGILKKRMEGDMFLLQLSLQESAELKERTFFLADARVLNLVGTRLEEYRSTVPAGGFCPKREFEERTSAVHPGLRGKAPVKRWLAPVLSAVFPGMGQFYNREIVKGTIFCAVFCFFLVILIAPLTKMAEKSTEFTNRDILLLVMFMIAMVLFYGVNISDAYYSSKKDQL